MEQAKGNELEAALDAPLSSAERALVTVIWLRDAIGRKGGAPVAELVGYADDLESIIHDLVDEQAADHAR